MKAFTRASLPTILLVTATAFFAPQNAVAEESGADPWTDRWLALEIHGGLGTPHGFGGLAQIQEWLDDGPEKQVLLEKITECFRNKVRVKDDDIVF